MNSKWSEVGRMINHYRYLIVVVVGVLIVGFVDDNSFMRRLQYELQISDLKKQIKEYDKFLLKTIILFSSFYHLDNIFFNVFVF